MEEARLSPSAVRMIADLPDGPGTFQPVLQVVDIRSVNTKSTMSAEAQRQSERFRMLLSDGVDSQQSMLATALNHLVREGNLRLGTIVHLTEYSCNTIQKRRIVIIAKLEVLQSDCAIIGNPKMFEKNMPSKGQEPNLPANAAQTNSGTYSGGPGMLESSVAPRAVQVANNPPYGGTYNGVQGTVGSPVGRTVEPGPNNAFSGGSYGAMPAQNTMNDNMAQPRSQQPLLNSHQNQRFAAPATAGVFGSSVVQPSYHQPPPVYPNRGPVAKNEAAPRVIPISALNPYQNRWTIKVRVTAKTDVRLFNNARGPGKVFSFDVLDAHGGEIRATCFNAAVEQFYNLIEVDKVYLVSRGLVKPAQKKFNPLKNDYELNLDTSTSIEVCSGDDGGIPRQHFNFRPISEIANMENETMVDLIGVVTSVSPSATIMRKNGMETQKRTLQLKDMSGCSVEVTFWGNLCNAEGQQLQLDCDSGLNPMLALKNVRVGEYNGKSVSTLGSSLLKINPDLPEAEMLRQWYITEGKTAACTSLSREMSSMGRTDVRKTTAQIKEENLGRSDKPDWITVKGAISHVNADSVSYPGCTSEVDGKRCNKKVTRTADDMWHCDKCDHTSKSCEHRYLVQCTILDHTGYTYATAFQETGEEIFGLTAQQLHKIKDEDQDEAQFTEIIQRALWQPYLFKLKVKEETYNDESRVKSNIVKLEKLDPSKESCFLLGAIDSLLHNGLDSTPGVNGAAAALNTGFNHSVAGQNVPSNNPYAMNMDGANQMGQQASIPGGMSTPPSATRNVQTCSLCGSGGHSSQNCPAGMDMQQAPAGGGFMASSYGSSAGKASSDLCFKCYQPGHFAKNCPGQQPPAGGAAMGSSYSSSAGNSRSGLCFNCNQPGHFAGDCPERATGPQRQTYGNGAVSGGYNRQSFGGRF